jgi:hypothetical protein
VYAETYGAVYGELLWRPRIELPLAPENHGRYLDYESELDGKVIPNTLRRGSTRWRHCSGGHAGAPYLDSPLRGSSASIRSWASQSSRISFQSRLIWSS